MRCSFCKIDVPLPCSAGNVATICVNYQKIGVSSGKNCACPPEDLLCNMPDCPRSVATVYGSVVVGGVRIYGQQVFDPRQPITNENVKEAYDRMQAATLEYNTLRQRLEEGK